ncbi:MAG: hypothetical protein IH590_04290, partial [Aquamicrobium sp.]|nr:hypothetical protein [Aquamicrobium sp.]
AAAELVDQIVRRPLVAAQEVRHLGVTYGPGTPLPDTVDDVEARFLLKRGSAKH